MIWNDKVVLVTGATSGFGAATARRFAAAGAKLIVVGRRTERLEALRAEVKVPVHCLTLDVRHRHEIEQAVAGLPPEFAGIDVLVNNAGLALGLEGAPEADLDLWETMVATNIEGLMVMTRLVLPGMVARGGGHVVNIGSVAGSFPYPGGNCYGATKAFVKQFTLNLRADLLGRPVRVTLIEPGIAETEFSEVRFSGDKSKAKAVYAGIEGVMTAEDVAEAVFWCADRPPHLNIDRLQLSPLAQAYAGFAFDRSGK